MHLLLTPAGWLYKSCYGSLRFFALLGTKNDKDQEVEHGSPSVSRQRAKCVQKGRERGKEKGKREEGREGGRQEERRERGGMRKGGTGSGSELLAKLDCGVTSFWRLPPEPLTGPATTCELLLHIHMHWHILHTYIRLHIRRPRHISDAATTYTHIRYTYTNKLCTICTPC